MAWILPAVQAGVGLYGAYRSGKKAKKADLGRKVGEINNRYRGENPSGIVTAEDKAQAERTRAIGNRSAARSAELGHQSVYRAAAARGLSGASAAALDSEVMAQEARDREANGLGAANQEYADYASSRGFGREKLMTAWGNDVGAAGVGAQQANAQNATMWNSILESIPGIASAWAPKLSASTNPNNYGGTAPVPLAPKTGSYDPLVPSAPVPVPALRR